MAAIAKHSNACSTKGFLRHHIKQQQERGVDNSGSQQKPSDRTFPEFSSCGVSMGRMIPCCINGFEAGP
jgi:hypothetical protein